MAAKFFWTNDEDEKRLRKVVLSTGELLEQTKALNVMTEPTRYQLMLLLAEGQNCVSDLSVFAGRHDSVVTRHLAKLEVVGLVEQRPSGKLSIFSLTHKGVALLRMVEAQI